MNDHSIELTKIRNNLEFASTAQFFHTFQSAFRPWPTGTQEAVYTRNADTKDYLFETEDLERLLLEVSERSRFEELIVKMLRLASHNRFINMSNWQTYFSKEFEKREFEQVNPFIPEVKQEDQPEPHHNVNNYFTMPLETRIHLLHLLCEWQLDEPERFREHLETEEDAVQWRVDPIGYDKKGATFWLFDDNRMYKETPKPEPVKKTTNKRKKRRTFTSSRKSSRRSTRTSAKDEAAEEEDAEEEEVEDEEEWVPWKLVCLTRFDWEQFPAKYKDSKNVDEQRFYRLLTEDLLPKVLPVLEEHEKELLKQQAIIHRKRSSRIMMRELEALERSSAEPEGPYSPGLNGQTRTSSRIEKRAMEKQLQEKESLAKAREERLLERERRIMEREYRALAREKRQESQDPPEKPVVQEEPVKEPVKEEEQEVKPKRKYTKRPKFDEFGNPIPRKVKLDKDGNPIPLKKRGRKPKNRNLEEENWMFDCICGVSGQNVDDGTPMIACEKCGIWQHIACLQKSGIIEKDKSLDNLVFICQRCDKGTVEDDVDIDEEEPSTQPVSHHLPTANPSPVQLPSIQPTTWQHQASSIREYPVVAQSAIPSNHQSQTPNTSQSIPHLQHFNPYGGSSMGNSILQSILNQEKISPVIPQSSIRSDPPAPQESSIRSLTTVQESSIRSDSIAQESSVRITNNDKDHDKE